MDVRVEKRIRNQKAKVLKWLVFLCFLFLVGRSFQLQVLHGERYQTLADGNRVRIIRIKPLRGNVLDRTGKILANNASSFTITVTYADLRNREEELALLAELLDLDFEDMKSRINKARQAPFEAYPIIRNAPIEMVSIIEEHSYDLPGIKTVVEPIRDYPHGELTAHFLGYMGEVSPEEHEQLKDDDYKIGDQIGKMGLERQYEPYLRGQSGYVYVEVDVWGRELDQLTEKPPITPTAGNDLQLTLDLAVQDSLVQALGAWEAGAGVALDPQTGAVLAFHSAPSFDPNLFTYGISHRDWKQLNSDPTRPLFNRAVQGTYPPASTFKLLIGLIGLEQGYIGPETHLPTACNGGMQIGNRYFKCWKPAGHGSLTLDGAITQSCDVYFYQVGLRTPLQVLSDYAVQAGFGKPSGIDLPGEANGFIPDLDWANRKFPDHAMPRGNMANLSIGQGEILSTPLQLARFFGAIANGGTLHTPFFVEKIISPSGELLEVPEREKSYLSVSDAHLQLLDEAAYHVVNGAHGTGGRAAIPGIEVCGKTGTAQNPHGEDHAWFVGYAPRHDPKIVAAVVVENSGHGSSVAAPIVRKMIETYLQNPEFARETSQPETESTDELSASN